MTNKYHYFYKITNKINNHYYYGVHNTDNLDDGYMGSGKRLKYAYEKYGIENFSKEILKFFETSKEAFQYESEIVTENLVRNEECYNLCVGGRNINQNNLIVVKDSNGNKFTVFKDDERFKNGDVVGVTKGTFLAKDFDGKIKRISCEDEKYKKGEIQSIHKGKTLVKDANNNFFLVSKNDEKVLNGAFNFYWKGLKHSEESKLKVSKTQKERQNQKGEKNSQYGTCWVFKEGANKKIKKDELNKYIEMGWIKGRIISNSSKEKMKKNAAKSASNTIWIYNDNIKKSTYVKKENAENYLNDGWHIGRKFYDKNG